MAISTTDDVQARVVVEDPDRPVASQELASGNKQNTDHRPTPNNLLLVSNRLVTHAHSSFCIALSSRILVSKYIMTLNTIRVSLLLVIATLSLVAGFAPPHRRQQSLGVVGRTSNREPRMISGSYVSSSSTAQNMIILGDNNELMAEAVSSARGEFVLWFFGGSGAGGIALGQFPKMFKKIQYIQSLKGQGSTLGGDKIGLSPLCGYPEDLSVKDVESVVQNPLSVEEIVTKFPNDGSFLAKRGYLTFASFQAANSNANRLAVRAIFDTFAQSTDTSTPDVAEQKLQAYREDITSLKSALLASKLVGFASLGVLFFLLGIAVFFSAGSVYNGWFPDWPGGQDLPWSLLDANDGAVWNIPKYWI